MPMRMEPTQRFQVEKELFSRFNVRDEYVGANQWVFLVDQDPLFAKKFKELYSAAQQLGYWTFARKRGNLITISVVKAIHRGPGRKSVYMALFLATFLSVAISGYELSRAFLMSLGYQNAPPALMIEMTVEFVASLLTILGIHELGHKFVTERAGEKASWPYFIPGPPYLLGAGFLGIGTFGAMIMAEEPPLDRNHLFDLGISGPLAGFALSLMVAAIGVALSPPMMNPLVVNSFGPYYSIFYRLPLIIQLFFILKGESPNEAALSPVLIASWIGMLVTFLNLLPASQLDGGHVFRSFLSYRQALGVSVAVAMIMMMTGYWLMGVLVLFMAFIPDPGPLEEVTPLARSRKALLLLDFTIIILTAVVLRTSGF